VLNIKLPFFSIGIKLFQVCEKLSIITAEMRQKIILKALSDPVFLKQLKEQPASALGVKQLNTATLADVNKILREIEAHARYDGGPCGIA